MFRPKACFDLPHCNKRKASAAAAPVRALREQTSDFIGPLYRRPHPVEAPQYWSKPASTTTTANSSEFVHIADKYLLLYYVRRSRDSSTINFKRKEKRSQPFPERRTRNERATSDARSHDYEHTRASPLTKTGEGLLCCLGVTSRITFNIFLQSSKLLLECVKSSVVVAQCPTRDGYPLRLE